MGGDVRAWQSARARRQASRRGREQPFAAGAIEKILLPIAQHLELAVEVAVVHPAPAEAVAEADVQADEPDLADRDERRDRGDVGLAQVAAPQVFAEKG